MAKKKDTDATPDDVTPAFGDSFGTPPTGPEADDVAELEHLRRENARLAELAAIPAEAKESPAAAELAKMRADLEATRAENATLKAQVAESSKVYPPGRKYVITLKDHPRVVVQPRAGEHPWDALKRITGLIASINSPEIGEAAEHEECGVYLPSGKLLRAFPKEEPAKA